MDEADEADQAATTAAWSFVRSFGSIWGVAIPAAIFNNRFKVLQMVSRKWPVFGKLKDDSIGLAYVER